MFVGLSKHTGIGTLVSLDAPHVPATSLHTIYGLRQDLCDGLMVIFACFLSLLTFNIVSYKAQTPFPAGDINPARRPLRVSRA